MTDLQFRSGEVPLRYRDQGAGRVVVCVHGWTMDLELWEPQAAGLCDSMRVIRHDRRGFGRSAGRVDAAQDGPDLLALLDHLRLPRAALVGMSQGARTVLAVALAAPERVVALVLDGPPDCLGDAGPDADGEPSIAALRALARESGLAAFRRAWRAHPLMRLRTSDARAHALVDAMLARYPGSDALAPEPASQPPLDARALARLQVPVLIVNGEHDTPARRRAGERLRLALPRAEHLLLPDAGHLSNLDNPAGYNGALRAFLQRQSRAAA